MSLESCFVCARPVLPFKGQFSVLPAYLLDEHDAALRQGAYGWCHMLCLSRSAWGAFWSERRIHHATEVMGFDRDCDSHTLTALRNPRTGEILVFQTDGVSFSISPAALDSSLACPDGALLPVSEEVNMELEPNLAREIRSALIEFGSVPLARLPDALDLTDTLLYPAALSGGHLELRKDLQRDWTGNWVSAVAQYHQFLPRSVMEIVR